MPAVNPLHVRWLTGWETSSAAWIEQIVHAHRVRTQTMAPAQSKYSFGHDPAGATRLVSHGEMLSDYTVSIWMGGLKSLCTDSCFQHCHLL